MPLAAGARLGPYEVLGPLGAGGMGEVYRASDTRLGRQVAVKILSERLAGDSEALARFEREARAVATLSHPGICTLHDVGREGDVSYLVMEMIEGETLATRLSRGALPLDQVLKLGAEIGDALAAAHERGVVHRDLKPGNIMLTRAGVKLLDFGLAKALEAAEGHTGTPVDTASVQIGTTQAGTVMGTLPYMAPEQLEGRRTDHRTDIFAFGAVLHEMATGARAFSGTSQASLMSAILTAHPPRLSELRPLAPPGLDPIVRTCLAKDPHDRWQATRDVVLQLRGLSDAPAARIDAPARRTAAPWAIAVAALALLAAVLFRPRPAPAHPVAFSIAPPRGGMFTSWAESNSIALSPDGTALAFAAREGKAAPRLWIRPLGSTEARPLPGTEGAAAPFWSPDGRNVGFAAQGKLKRIDVAGGAPVVLCDLPSSGGLSASWGRESILLSQISFQASRLYRVPASGGTAVVEIEDVASHRVGWPLFLPDGEHYLYLLREDHAWHLMAAGPNERAQEVAPVASTVGLLGPDRLVFVRDGTLVGQHFDWRRRTLDGEAAPISDTVRYFLPTAGAAFTAAASGAIAYQGETDVSRLTWVDRSGREVGTIGAPGDHLTAALSPDGKRVLFDRARKGTGTYDVWSWDVALQAETRLTSDPEVEAYPRWLPGGAVVFSSNAHTRIPQLIRHDLGSGQESEILPPGGFRVAEEVSPDGRSLLYRERGSGGWDLWALSLSGAPEPRPVIRSAGNVYCARFSPDGRYLAFVSDESGTPEAYVMPYPGPGEKRRLSASTATIVRWRRDGRELAMFSGDGRMWSVPVQTTPGFEAGTPVVLFTASGKPWLSFELATDGQRFLAVVPTVIGNEEPVTVVTNWQPSSR